jgi:hypothetical protein
LMTSVEIKAFGWHILMADCRLALPGPSARTARR